jgi:hypothetical protein
VHAAVIVHGEPFDALEDRDVHGSTVVVDAEVLEARHGESLAMESRTG